MKTYELKVQNKRTGDVETRHITQIDAFKAHQVAKHHWGETHNVLSIFSYWCTLSLTLVLTTLHPFSLPASVPCCHFSSIIWERTANTDKRRFPDLQHSITCDIIKEHKCSSFKNNDCLPLRRWLLLCYDNSVALSSSKPDYKQQQWPTLN